MLNKLPEYFLLVLPPTYNGFGRLRGFELRAD